MTDRHVYRLPVTACLMALWLTSCQTTPPTSSSVLEETVTAAVEAERNSLCSDLKPSMIDAGDFNASPASIRTKITADADAWLEACA